MLPRPQAGTASRAACEAGSPGSAFLLPLVPWCLMQWLVRHGTDPRAASSGEPEAWIGMVGFFSVFFQCGGCVGCFHEGLICSRVFDQVGRAVPCMCFVHFLIIWENPALSWSAGFLAVLSRIGL